MNRAIIVREKVTRLVKLLVEQRIKVTQRGSTAFVSYDSKGYPEIVNIPYIPDDATEEFLNAIEGFLDHEVAHVLFSDYKAIKKAKANGVAELANIVEDSFIERMMAQSFQGSGLNLSNVGEFFLKNYTDKKIKEDPENIGAYLIVPAIRAYAGQTVFKDYMSGKWHMIKDIDSKIREFAEKTLPFIKTSDEAVNAAIEIETLLNGKKPEDEGEGGEEGKESKGGKEKKGGAKPKPEGEPEEGEGEGESEEGDETETKVSVSEEGDETEGDAESEESGPGEDDTEEEGGSPTVSLDDHEGQPEDHESSIDTSKIANFDDALSEALSEMAAKEAKSSSYLVYTKDFDKIAPMVVGERGRWDDSMLKDMQDKVDHMIGPIQKDLERAIAARSLSVWSAGHRSGRLNASALARLTTFNDDRAFRRKHVNPTKDVAVQLVVDCSGSMNGQKILFASYVAYGLMSVLDRLNIPCEVIGFTTDRGMPAEFAKEQSRLGVTYARNQALYIPIFKSFGDRMSTESKKRLAALPEVYWLNENVDGESIQIAATRLAVRRESRKIMMVLSDGNPACPGDRSAQQRHLKETVKSIESSGVDVLGIGVCSEAPKHFYSKYVLLNDLSELPTTVISQIKRLLMQG